MTTITIRVLRPARPLGRYDCDYTANAWKKLLRVAQSLLPYRRGVADARRTPECDDVRIYHPDRQVVITGAVDEVARELHDELDVYRSPDVERVLGGPCFEWTEVPM